MTGTYQASPELTKAVLDAILAPVPFFISVAVKAVPMSIKEGAVYHALTQVVPLSLGSIAMTQNEGSRITLTKHGELREEVQASMLRRIASWFIPAEVKQVSSELQKDVVRMAESGYATASWRLEIVEREVVLVVLNTSLIKQSSDTVVDLFFASHDSLKALKDRVLSYMPRR